jgi:hypothetical protein
VSNLDSGAVMERGVKKLRLLLGEEYGGKCEAGKRVFIEGGPSDPSFCLDMYGEGLAPGWGPKGLTADNSHAVLALYRVAQNKINHVWLCPDEAPPPPPPLLLLHFLGLFSKPSWNLGGPPGCQQRHL